MPTGPRGQERFAGEAGVRCQAVKAPHNWAPSTCPPHADQILQRMEANHYSTFTCPSAKPSHLQCSEHHVLTRCSPAGSSPLLPVLLAQLGTSPGSHAGFGHKKSNHEATVPAWEQGNPGAGQGWSRATPAPGANIAAWRCPDGLAVCLWPSCPAWHLDLIFFFLFPQTIHH